MKKTALISLTLLISSSGLCATSSLMLTPSELSSNSISLSNEQAQRSNEEILSEVKEYEELTDQLLTFRNLRNDSDDNSWLDRNLKNMARSSSSKANK